MRVWSWTLIAAAIVALTGCQASENADAGENTMASVEDETSPAGSIYCDAVEARTTVDECADLERQKAKLYPGGAAIQAPSPMTRGRSYVVTLLVDSRPARVIQEVERKATMPPPAPTPVPRTAPEQPDPAPATKETLPPTQDTPPEPVETLPDTPTPGQVLERLPGETERFQPWIGRYMSAQLVGPDDVFDIKPMDKESVKQVPANSQVRWSWRVRPEKEGTHTLFVTTRAEGRVNGKTYTLWGGDSPRSITVEVTMLDWAKDQFVYFTDWLTSLQGLLAALTALVVAWFGFRAAFGNKGRTKDPPPAP